MIDLHTHTFFSDGSLIPSELVYTGKRIGYTGIAITDHADYSNYDFILPRISEASKVLSAHYELAVVPGVELTYLPPGLIFEMSKLVKAAGAKIVVVHGETAAENVPPGTNLAAVKSGVHVLAHPGFLTEEEATIAAKNNVRIEITARTFHGKTNAHVAKMAMKCGAKLILNSDTHIRDHILTPELVKKTLDAAGLNESHLQEMQNNAAELLKEIGVK
ncbi:MAG: histidinol phosphate phosphatase domain-containing protein [Firmicutes bacterium]|nr:histidinol phosphate phosphatase domain-containing protein [Bacillota bacterium]